jgi:hypothetical protein
MDTENTNVEAVETTVDRMRLKGLMVEVVASLATQAVPVSMETLAGGLVERGLTFKTNTLRNALRQLVKGGSVVAIGGKKNRTYSKVAETPVVAPQA